MRICIVGLGLIGGSLGLALRQTRGKKHQEIIGYVRRPEAAAKAVQLGIADRVEVTLESAVSQASIVVLAPPPLAMEAMLKQISPHLSAGCLVTDVASTKAQVMAWAEKALPPGTSFIGGHPMAGKEKSGMEAAAADLFNGCTYCLTPSPRTPKKDLDMLKRLVEQIGARPLIVDAAEHDYLVAGISHLPFLLSTALVLATSQSPAWARMSRLASSGYRDVTRLASGDTVMYRDICLTNKEATLRWIDNFTAELERVRRLVESGDEELEKALALARRARQDWLENA